MIFPFPWDSHGNGIPMGVSHSLAHLSSSVNSASISGCPAIQTASLAAAAAEADIPLKK